MFAERRCILHYLSYLYLHIRLVFRWVVFFPPQKGELCDL